MHGPYVVGKGEEENLPCDPGSQIRLLQRGRKKRRVEITNGKENKKKMFPKYILLLDYCRHIPRPSPAPGGDLTTASSSHIMSERPFPFHPACWRSPQLPTTKAPIIHHPPSTIRRNSTKKKVLNHSRDKDASQGKARQWVGGSVCYATPTSELRALVGGRTRS